MSCCHSVRGLCRLLFTFAFAFLIQAENAQGQMTGIVVETIADHDTTDIAAVDGMMTYRVYAEFTNATDKISAVYGDASAPMTLTSSDGFYNAMFGGDFALEVNPALFAFFFESAFDSWFTIGYAPGDAPASNLTQVGLTEQLVAFNNTGQFDLSDAIGGSYFTTDDPHAIAGEDLKVLLGQFTTSGTFTGVFNVQVFVEGQAGNAQQLEGVVFTNSENPSFGCTDEGATNYDPAAQFSDESCIYPCTLSLNATTTDATCPGGSDGTVQLLVQNDQFEVFYGLDGDEPNQLLAAFSGLSVGEHHVQAIDGAGCTASVTFFVNSPADFELIATSVSAVCEGPGGALTLEATGGTPPYAFTYEDETNSHGAFALVPEGLHTVTLEDAAGCSTDLEVEVVGVSTGAITVVSTPTCSNPNGGSVQLELNNSAPEGITWLTDIGEFSVNEAGLVTGLPEGSYSAILTAGGCADTVTWELDRTDDTDSFFATVTDATCAGSASGTVQLTGPNTDWTVTWLGESQSWDENGITGLAAGSYVITATDGECSVDFDALIGEPSEFYFDLSNSSPQCDGDATGMIHAELFGGTAPWSWAVNGSDPAAYAGPIELNNLNPGTYALSATDANGCQAEAITIISWPLALPQPEVLVQAPTTYSNGTATALVDPSFEVVWSHASGEVIGTNATQENLESGLVLLTVTNAEGCSVVQEVDIPFAGCSAVGAEDWPEAAEGFYPTGFSSVHTAMPVSEEWVLQFPSNVTPPTANYELPVSSFLPESIAGLPNGIEAIADFANAVPVDGAWCLELTGQTNEAGTYPITVTGTYYIELFGSVFPAPGFTFMKVLVVSDELAPLPIEGCTYVWAANYNPNAVVDDGSCTIAGCMNSNACNFEPLASVSTACDFTCLGCTYPAAENYSIGATRDDGTCTFPPSNEGTCMWDGDGNAYINSNDLLLFLGQYDTPCE